MLALHRTDGNVVKAYGPKLAFYLTLPGALENSILRSAAVIFLWGGATFSLLRRDLILPFIPSRVLTLAGVWLAFAFASAVFGRLLVDYYLMGIVPPLLILAGAFFCHGLYMLPARQQLVFWLSLVVATATLGFTQHRELLTRLPLAYDSDLVARTAVDLRDLGMTADDRLLVLNRGMALYLATRGYPPTAFFHGKHLMTNFPTSVNNPLALSLSANPRFIVFADPAQRMIAKLPQRYRLAFQYLAAHYRTAAIEKGRDDTFTVYEFVK